MDSQGAGHKQNIINYRQTRVHNTNKKSSSEYFHTLTLSRPKEKLSHNFKPVRVCGAPDVHSTQPTCCGPRYISPFV